MTFNYNKKNAKCMWCKRTQNPHPDYSYETIPTKVFTTQKGKEVEIKYRDVHSRTLTNDVQYFPPKERVY